MNMTNYDRRTLKERAKASLRGVQPRTWKVTLVYLLIASLLPAVLSMWNQLSGMGAYFDRLAYLAQSGALENLQVADEMELLSLYWRSGSSSFTVAGGLSLFVSILVSLIQTVMGYGYKSYALKLYRGEQTAVRDVFSGFGIAGRIICTAIMIYIFTFLWSVLAALLFLCAVMILVAVVLTLASEVASVVLLLLLIPLYIGFLVAMLWITYRYSLAPYFIMTTDMGTMDAIRESKNAMRGNIGRRFVLDLSYFGWDLLAVLIMMVVVCAGVCVAVFAVSMELSLSGAIPEYMGGAVLASVLTKIVGGACVAVVIAALVALPLTLWLAAYRGSAEAGFFLIATGQDAPPVCGGGPVSYTPPQPSGIWDNVPQPPAFTTPAPPTVPPVIPPAPPAPPAPPIPPVPTGGPAGPGPDDPIPAAPAAPEVPAEAAPEAPAAPEVPAETAPETPAEPETPQEER